MALATKLECGEWLSWYCFAVARVVYRYYVAGVFYVVARWLLSGWSHMVLWFLEMTLVFPIFYIIKVSFIPTTQMLQDES